MNSTAPIQSRRERAALSPAEKNRQAFGRFIDDIRRCKALYPTQRDVAWLLAMATLREGFNSVAFASLNELTCVDDRRAPFSGLGANDLSLAVMGGLRGDKVVQGLKHFGIVLVDERSRIEAAMPLTVWMLVTDVNQWRLPADGWRFDAPELAEWQMHLRACRRRHTGALGALAVEPDLHDARADVTPMAHADASNALDLKGSETATDGRRPLSQANAPVVPPRAGRGETDPRHSESRNANSPTKARCVPKVGMNLSLKKDQRPKLKLWSSEELKSALYELENCADDDRVRELLVVILGEEAGHNDAGKWIVRRWSNKSQVQIIMDSVVERLNDQHLPQVRQIGGLAESYWKKQRNLLQTNGKQGL